MKIEHPNFKNKDGKIYLVKCPKCKIENYASNVCTGICAWCGYDASPCKLCVNGKAVHIDDNGNRSIVDCPFCTLRGER